MSYEGPIDGQVRCAAEGYPTPQIKWYYCDQPHSRYVAFYIFVCFECTHNFGKVPTMGFQSWFPKLAVPTLSSVNILASPRVHCDAAWISHLPLTWCLMIGQQSFSLLLMGISNLTLSWLWLHKSDWLLSVMWQCLTTWEQATPMGLFILG